MELKRGCRVRPGEEDAASVYEYAMSGVASGPASAEPWISSRRSSDVAHATGAPRAGSDTCRNTLRPAFSRTSLIFAPPLPMMCPDCPRAGSHPSFPGQLERADQRLRGIHMPGHRTSGEFFLSSSAHSAVSDAPSRPTQWRALGGVVVLWLLVS